MSKRSGKQPRRFWSKREEEFLIGCMRDLVNEDSKWKLDCGQFKAGFYGECEKRIITAFPGTNLRAHPHIDSKIKAWRKQYHLLQDMLKLSGFGWDDTEKMILVDSDDVWENFVRVKFIPLLHSTINLLARCLDFKLMHCMFPLV